MPKRKPSERRKPEKTPQPPRDRLAEIRAEIQDVQQQIETKRVQPVWLQLSRARKPLKWREEARVRGAGIVR